MARGKYQKTWAIRPGKGLTALLAVVLVLSFAIGGTVAYLATNSGSVTNTFQPGRVSCSVNTNGTVTNTGNVDAYIRAFATVNWMDANGNVYAEPVSYTVNSGNGWTYDAPYLYYTTKVAPNNATGVISVIYDSKAKAPAEGYYLKVVIVAEAIQAEGIATTPQDAWDGAPRNN